MTPAVSIVIPVKDGGEDLARCLGAIRAQALDHEPEVVVVDSGSTDGSVATAREYGARVLEIPPEEFDHGATRNLAAEAARGEVLVFISQDAEPVGDGWLAALTAPLADDRVAGVYGRQVARPDAVPPEAFFLDFVYGPEPRVQELITGRAPSMETTLFSNVNSAIRRSAWEAFPFATDLIMSEDQDWSRRAMEAGWRIVYEPRAVVRHSHVVLDRIRIPALLRLRGLVRAGLPRGRDGRLASPAPRRRRISARRDRLAGPRRTGSLDPVRARLRNEQVGRPACSARAIAGCRSDSSVG